jgi:DNA-binding GntR family transcriptional regulator
MPVLVYAGDPQWGVAAVDNHRQLIAALRRRETPAVIEHAVWQFTDAARRLTEMLNGAGIFG